MYAHVTILFISTGKIITRELGCVIIKHLSVVDGVGVR